MQIAETNLKAVAAELAEIEQRDGTLKPARVVAYARRNKRSALHGCFDWNDETASAKWRLHQARNLIIRVRVRMLPQSTERVKVWISLPEDRHDGTGYRSLVKVLSDTELRRRALAMALAELQTFRRKHQHLKELAGVFAAIDEAAESFEQQAVEAVT